MEPAKHINTTSDHISSPENDHQPEKSTDESAGLGRSYECTFCKRGFTNAQALGGHMNIHRKDKAKAKQKNNQDGPSKANDHNYANLRYFPQIPSSDRHHEMGYYRPIRGHEVSYQVYLPSSNPNFQTGSYFPDSKPDNFEGRLDANLSLSIGRSPSKGEEGEDAKTNEVDLELRLGHIDQ